MLQRFLFIALTLCTLSATAQWQQTGSKVRYVNGLGIPTKDTAAGVAADSSQIVIRPADSALYIKYKRTWLRVGGGGGSIAGSGTTNSIPKFTSSSAIGNSQIFDNGTNVGIGTTSPATKLEIYGGATGTVTNMQVGNASTAFLVGVDGANNPQIRTAQSVPILFYTAGLERMRISSAGDVGIGTTSPTDKVSITAGALTIGFGNNDKSSLYGGIGFGSSLRLFNGSGTETVRWDAGGAGGNSWVTSGNVGIGTTSPAAKLSVQGTTLINTNTDNGVDKLQVSGSMNVSTNIKVGTYLISSYNNEILAGVDASGYYFANGASGTSNIPINFGDRASYIGFKTSPSTAAGIEKMRITSSGRILMGAILPTDNGVDALQVSGSMNVSTLATTNNLSVTTNATVGGTLRATGTTTLGTTNTGALTASSLDVTSGSGTFANLYSNGLVQMLGVNVKYRNISATYTATTGDDYFINITSGTFTLNLPTAATPYGQVYVIKNSGTGTVTLDPFSTQTIDGSTTVTMNVQNQTYTIIGDGTNWKIVSKYL